MNKLIDKILKHETLTYILVTPRFNIRISLFLYKFELVIGWYGFGIQWANLEAEK